MSIDFDKMQKGKQDLANAYLEMQKAYFKYIGHICIKAIEEIKRFIEQ